METLSTPSPGQSQLTDIIGLRLSGIFPKDNEPSIRTLRDWTKLRRIPHHRVGHFVYFDPVEVSIHIRTKLKVQARGCNFRCPRHNAALAHRQRGVFVFESETTCTVSHRKAASRKWDQRAVATLYLLRISPRSEEHTS